MVITVCGVSSALGMSNSKEYDNFAMKNPVMLVGQPVPHSIDSSGIHSQIMELHKICRLLDMDTKNKA
jgi:hypothetical protein